MDISNGVFYVKKQLKKTFWLEIKTFWDKRKENLKGPKKLLIDKLKFLSERQSKVNEAEKTQTLKNQIQRDGIQPKH
jgi:hypothetical protein